MCLIAFAWRCHPRYRLALIANRDEAHERAAAPAGVHPDFADVFGGRDLEQGGSWLMVSSRGRLAAVTNVRVGIPADTAPRSRGALVDGFVTGDDAADDWLRALGPDAPDYGRFNTLVWDGQALAFATNHPQFAMAEVAPGVHAMSNGAFDAPWPKSGHATDALSEWLGSPIASTRATDDFASLAPLLDALADTTPAPDAALPDTGVGLALERMLSPPFVRGERYGTRCSTLVLVEDGALTFVERRFDAGANITGETAKVLPLQRG